MVLKIRFCTVCGGVDPNLHHKFCRVCGQQSIKITKEKVIDYYIRLCKSSGLY